MNNVKVNFLVLLAAIAIILGFTQPAKAKTLDDYHQELAETTACWTM